MLNDFIMSDAKKISVVNKQSLILEISQLAGISKDQAKAAIDAVTRGISGWGIKNAWIPIRGMGTFTVEPVFKTQRRMPMTAKISISKTSGHTMLKKTITSAKYRNSKSGTFIARKTIPRDSNPGKIQKVPSQVYIRFSAYETEKQSTKVGSTFIKNAEKLAKR